MMDGCAVVHFQGIIGTGFAVFYSVAYIIGRVVYLMNFRYFSYIVECVALYSRIEFEGMWCISQISKLCGMIGYDLYII